MVRRARKTGQVQIIIADQSSIESDSTLKDLVKDYPEVVTVAVNTNTAKLLRFMGTRQRLFGVKIVYVRVF